MSLISLYQKAREVGTAGGAILRLGDDRLLVAKGVDRELADPDELDQFLSSAKAEGRWVVSCFSYELKNRFEGLESSNPSRVQMPEIAMFVPKEVEIIKVDQLEADHPQRSYPALEPGMDFQEYSEGFQRIMKHLLDGDIYEVNFCQEFHTECEEVDTAALFCALWERNAPVHGGFFSYKGVQVVSASPERFLCYDGDRLLSEPIKGTRRRGVDELEDSALRRELEECEKERSENIMIVDLVRNDLSRVASKGSVKVDSLCEIRSFPAVHQMVSMVSCEPRPEVPFSQVLRSTFPMGSMTGAPKVSAMMIADRLETFQRGAYSGSMGYFSPEGHFDLNVLIRTLFYDGKNLTCPVGGAITIRSKVEDEYQECLVKVQSIQNVLHGS